MKKILIITGIAISCLCGCATISTQRNDNSSKFTKEVNDRLIIYYDSTIGNALLLEEVKSYGADIVYQYKSLNGVAIKLPKGADIENAIKHFQKVKGVLQVTKDQVMQLH